MTTFPTDAVAWDIAGERQHLAGRLADARSRPGAPIGGDDDDLAMSLPPYHTACPNPDLADLARRDRP